MYDDKTTGSHLSLLALREWWGGVSKRSGAVGILIVIIVTIGWLLSLASVLLQTGGISGSPVLLAGIAIGGIIIVGITFIAVKLWATVRDRDALQRKIQSLELQGSLKEDVPIVDRNDEKKLAELVSHSERIIILSSRSSSYLTQFNRILKKETRSKPLKLSIIARRDGTAERDMVLRDALRQWLALAKGVTFKMDVAMSATDNWAVMFRGLIFDEKDALLGFYVNEGDVRKGTEDDYLWVTREGNVVQQLLLGAALNATIAIKRTAVPVS